MGAERISDIRCLIDHAELSRAIRVRQFQTLLQDATCLRLGQEQGDAKRVLDGLRFDYAPVEQEGVPVGYVMTSELLSQSNEPVECRLRPIAPDMIVSGDASFRDLLRWMDRGFLFVLEGNRLTGFVTPADANRQEARLYFYLLLADVEVGLANLVRGHFKPVRSAIDKLSPSCRKGVSTRMERDCAQNVDGDVVSYFLLSDLVKVVGKTEEIRLGFTGGQWGGLTGSLVSFRDWVMHPARSDAATDYSIEKLTEFDDRLTELSNKIREHAGAIAKTPAL